LSTTDSTRAKYAVHGPAIEIACDVPAMAEQVKRLFEPFAVNNWPSGFLPTLGIIRPFAQSEVIRHLSPGARPVPTNDHTEIYADGERFWLVDDRWGMTEVNLIRSQFRSWIIPAPSIDPIRISEAAIVWPLAQLLRARGLFLLPAVSVVRDGWAVMIICPFTLEAELVAMIRAGYKIIGQRWTAVREEDGRLALLHLPGMVERSFIPRLRSVTGAEVESAWADLSREYIGSWQNHAFCDAVLITDGGRRNCAAIRDIDPNIALETLRGAWPLIEVHPQRKFSPLPQKLAQHTRICELQLSRSSRDLLDQLAMLRVTPVGKMCSDADRDLAITPWAGLRPASGLAA
jgi:hypothetical protein